MDLTASGCKAKRRAFLAVLLAAASSAGATASDYAPHEVDFSGLGSAEYGVVESVRHAQLPRLHDVFEHSINPKPSFEVVVRLDDGRAITIVQRGTFHPGVRLLVIPHHKAVAVATQ